MSVLAPDPVTLTRRAQVTVGGWVRHPLRLDAALLALFDVVDVPDVVVVCTADGAHGCARALRRVGLRGLIDAARPAFAERTDFKRMAVVTVSAEGYRALFSWNELFNSALGDGVLVAWDCPQAPLPGRAGPFALVSLHDRATGLRYVQRLASVELHELW